MSIWACRKCGNLTGGSDGAPQCASCKSFEVQRVETVVYPWQDNPTITDWASTQPGEHAYYYTDGRDRPK